MLHHSLRRSNRARGALNARACKAADRADACRNCLHRRCDCNSKVHAHGTHVGLRPRRLRTRGAKGS